MKFKYGFGLTAGLLMAVLNMSSASAYSCQSEFNRANTLIQEAEKLVKKDTDSRIVALIEKAKGISRAGLVSHAKASEGHVGATGKFMHGQSVSMGRQAQSVAKEALFLLTGQPR